MGILDNIFGKKMPKENRGEKVGEELKDILEGFGADNEKFIDDKDIDIETPKITLEEVEKKMEKRDVELRKSLGSEGDDWNEVVLKD